MYRALMVRSIPLHHSTRNAWKEAGALFARRDSNPDRIARIAGDMPIINLGHSGMFIEGSWNHAAVVAPLLTPKGTRALMTELLPAGAYLGAGKYWLKGQGRGGTNKEMIQVDSLFLHDKLRSQMTWSNGDVQKHIEGVELRVVTVGHRVVQVTKRTGPDHDRQYQWVGLNGTDAVVKDLARTAARKLTNEKTIIGWDIIQTSGTHAVILEGNSCPGVNEATAYRILNEVERVEDNE